ncbi:Concanavalin A-like lectin/glucanase, subgroup [Cynara cardunculus var. scolymus]|uniref:non-specific serine/threonine protein kinase n=1 Tax=Cynara cardunculus var. scolymus TaxID=59895 RepID=A0A124SCR5_CYNCS|nr:Concanavalin A-like lectin/glucanase, subgroup [Cynara cardunculus var. scolymus]
MSQPNAEIVAAEASLIPTRAYNGENLVEVKKETPSSQEEESQMGICLSARIKAESPYYTGVSSRNISTDANDISNSSCSKASSVPPTPRSEGEILQSTNLKSFSYSDLRTATRNFRPDSVLGEGGFGSVFKGWIDEQSFAAAKPGTGVVIAVKRLNQESFQGHREWLAEVNYLGQFSHPNLVHLIGYCLEDEHRLLVYEFMPRGSLENHLFRRGSYFQPLSWSLRLKVALGAAKGLAFLHSAETKVIYRDFKTSNVLLDSVCGVVRITMQSSLILGWQRMDQPAIKAMFQPGSWGRHLTTKSDVYSFGVVLLEMLSGRRAVDKNRPSGEHSLVEWAKPYLAHKRKLFRVLDNRLEGQYTIDGAHAAANLSLRCISMDPRFRPNMDEVVKELEQLQDPKGMTRARRHSVNETQGRRRVSRDGGSSGRAGAYPRPSASAVYRK